MKPRKWIVQMGVVYVLELTFANGQTSRRVFEVGQTLEVGEGPGAVDVESIPIYVRDGQRLLVVVRVRGHEIPFMRVLELDPAELARPPRVRAPDKHDRLTSWIDSRGRARVAS